MSAKVTFTPKPLRLAMIAALASLSVPVESMLLPPSPLALSPSWNCQDGNGSRLCKFGWRETADLSQVVHEQTTGEPDRWVENERYFLLEDSGLLEDELDLGV